MRFLSVVSLIISFCAVQILEAFVNDAFLTNEHPARVNNARRINYLSMKTVEVQFLLSEKKVQAVGATPLSQVCSNAGVTVKYNCRQGHCGTCTINVDGRNVKACQTKLDPFRRVVKIKK